MEGMRLPKNYMAVILGKYQSSIYREFNRNRSGGVYTGNEAQAMSEQRRLDNKPSPKIDDYALMNEITALFKKRSVTGSDFRPIEDKIPRQPGKTGFNIDYLYCFR
jgi:IS30 family transposase